MADGLSDQDLLTGSYDCVDRIVLNGYFRPGHNAGGLRVWWLSLTGSVDTLDNTHLMRLAGRFSRRIRGWAKANGVPVIDCRAGERKHDLAEEYLKTAPVEQGVFLILARRRRLILFSPVNQAELWAGARPTEYDCLGELFGALGTTCDVIGRATVLSWAMH